MSYAKYIGARDGRRYLVDANGNTNDIIRAILQADAVCQPFTASLAPVLRGSTVTDTCRNLWQFWKDHVKYKEDPDNFQFVKSPRELYHSGEGDCKSYSIALASCLKNLGIPYMYRFVTEEAGKDFHHVYIVAKPQHGSEIIIDCVLDRFNYQNPYARKRDIAGKAPVPQHRGGIGKLNVTPDGKLQVGAGEKLDLVTPNMFTPGVNETWWAKQLEEERNALFGTILYGPTAKTVYKYYAQISNMIVADIFNAHPAGIKRSAIADSLLNNLDNLLKISFCMIYAFWDNNQLGIFPIGLDGKKQQGLDMKQDLLDLGLREATLKAMCNYSVWNMYGVSLDYLLYRCSNKVKYGTYWKPVNGVPYYHVPTGTLRANGAPLEQTVRLASCFPYNGGCTRPLGMPYWSVGGFIVRNKATDSMFEGFIKNNPKPAIIQNYTPPSQVEANMAIYQKWLNGNIPGLPVILPPNKVQISGTDSARIGYGVAEIVSIVTAVVAAVATIVGLVIRIVEQVKAGNVANIPDVARDFQTEFETVDGCSVGSNSNGVRLKCCPDGTCVPYNPNDPTHQPAAGNFAAAPQRSGSLFLIGGGALLLAGMLSGSKSDS